MLNIFAFCYITTIVLFSRILMQGSLWSHVEKTITPICSIRREDMWNGMISLEDQARPEPRMNKECTVLAVPEKRVPLDRLNRLSLRLAVVPAITRNAEISLSKPSSVLQHSSEP